VSHAKEIKAENIREVLRQHGAHGRHVENERTWFLVSYLIGISTLLGQTADQTNVLKWVLPVAILPTVVGLVLSIRWGQTFEHHREQFDAIIPLLGVPPIKVDGKEDKPDMVIKTGWFYKKFPTRFWFNMFYSITLIGLVVGSILVNILPAAATTAK
jgi:hypothetical protein